MPEMPDKNLEQLLRDYAQQRREAAGTPSMHPATRRVLQAEVKQQFGAGAAPGRASRPVLASFWPRWAFALGLAVVLVIGAILALPPANHHNDLLTLAKVEAPRDVAVADPAGPERYEPLPATAPPTAPSTPVTALKTLSAEGSARIAAVRSASAVNDPDSSRRADPRTESQSPDNLKAASHPPAKMASKEEVSRSLAKADANDSVNSPTRLNERAFTAGKGGLESAQTGDTSAAIGQTVQTFTFNAGAASEQSNVGNLAASANAQTLTQAETPGQRYRSTAVAEMRQAGPALQVLDEFVVRQNGGALTIVDRDGSAYHGFARVADANPASAARESSGAIQLAPNANSGGRGGQLFNQRAPNDSNYSQLADRTQSLRFQQVAGPISAPVQNITANLFFHVEGTNRSLNQRVVFTGNLIQNGAALNTLNYGANLTTANASNLNPRMNQMTQQSPASQVGWQNSLNNTRDSVNTFNNFINGRVQLDNKEAGELNALQVEP
jgi:hypothetical protein